MTATPATAVGPSAAASRREVIVGRQPIFDRSLDVHGYELLYRTAGRTDAWFADADAASAEVIATGFVDIGLFNVVDRGRAYINVTRDFMFARELMALPADRVALEFPGDAVADDEFLEVLDDYKAEGYRLVMDGGRVTRENLALVKRVQVVKLDLNALGIDETLRQAELIAPLGREIIAYRVETEEQYRAVESAGVDYFQGFFFARPRIVSGSRVSSNKLTTLRLLAKLHDPETSVDEVSALLSQDAGLSYKLMRFINSAALSLPGKIESIQRAVVFTGIATIKRWASLMVVASVEDKPSELTRTLLVRARLCERLCAEAQVEEPGSAFTVGLFSGLDALLDCPLATAIEDMPLAPELEQALLAHQGALGESLACALAYEQGEWSNVSFRGLSAPAIGELYEEAVAWAGKAMSGI